MKTPICEECNEEMLRYGPALDTGKMGWMCDLCGWSWDDEDNVKQEGPPTKSAALYRQSTGRANRPQPTPEEGGLPPNFKQKQSCRTCRFADWEYTEHEKPRIKRDWALCSAPIDVSAVRLPDSVQVVPSLAAYLERSRHGVGPHFGEKCPCYEAAEPLPPRSQMAEELKASGWRFNEHWKCWLDPNAPAYSGGYGTVHAWRKMKKDRGAK